MAGLPPGKGTSWRGRACPPSLFLKVSISRGWHGDVSEEEGALWEVWAGA